ncbi:MAG: hypothetical protein ACR2NZ_20970 [Rubripirellula sp.]
MKRRSTARQILGAAFLAVTTGGCAGLVDRKNESIIRVQSRANPAKAQRLTLAAVSAMENGKIDYAFDKLIAALEADGDYGPAHNNIGLLHYDEGNLYPAVLAFERAMTLMPQDPTVYYNLGLTLEAAGKLDEALDLYWQAVEMDPIEPHYLGNLVRLRVRMGENSPDVIAQLQDLILIETRPDWKRWADKELALDLNIALDRGPETPDFNSSDRDDEESEGDQRRSTGRVIDLTPEDQKVRYDEQGVLLPKNHDRLRSSEDLPEPRPRRTTIEPPEPGRPSQNVTPNELRGPGSNEPSVDSRPIPIRSKGAFESLPPSIDLSPDPELSELLRK